MNHALEENLYVLVVCIVNRIPVFVVGKPGASKTLAMQVLSNNLQGEQSPRKFWRRFPPVHLIQVVSDVIISRSNEYAQKFLSTQKFLSEISFQNLLPQFLSKISFHNFIPKSHSVPMLSHEHCQGHLGPFSTRGF